MSKYKGRGGRPSKGERKLFTTRLPIELADLVEAEADARDVSFSEYLAAIVAIGHGREVDLPPRVRPVDEQLQIGVPISA